MEELGEILGAILQAIGVRALVDFVTLYTKPFFRQLIGGHIVRRVLSFSERMAHGAEIAETSIKDAVRIFYHTEGPWIEFVAEYLIGMGVDRTVFDELRRRGVRFSDPGTMQLVGRSFLQPLLNLVLPSKSIDWSHGGITPLAGIQSAERYLAANLQFQMNAWYMHMISDTISLGAFKSLKDLPNAISWSYGLGWLSWLVMGVPFRLTISEPMERYYNKRLRPTFYSRKQIIDLYNAGMIQAIPAYKYLSELGWSNDKIANLLLLEEEKPSTAQVRQLVERGAWNLDDVKQYFKMRGIFAPLRDDLAVRVYYNRAYRLGEELLRQLDRSYLAGKTSMTDWWKAYILAKYRTDEAQLVFDKLLLQKEMKEPEEGYVRRLTPANIGRLYQLRHYTLSRARLALLDVGFEEATVPDFLLLYTPPTPKEEEAPEISASLLGRMYKSRVIGRDEYERELREREFTTTDIARLERLHRPVEPKPPEPVPPRELSLAVVGRLYREGYRPRAWAEEHLARLRISPGDIATLLDTVYSPLPPEEAEPRRLPVAVLGSLWRRGKINDAEFRAFLLQLGYTARDTDYYLLFYTEEALPLPEPIPPTELSISTVGRLHAGQYITTTEGIERLERVNIRAEDARLLLTTLYTPPEPEEPGSRQLSTAQVGSMFQRGIVTEPEARDMWEDWRWTSEDQTRLLEYYARPVEVPEPPPAPPELSPTTIGRLYQRGGLTYGQAITRLESVPYEPEDARLLLDYIYLPPEPEIVEPRRLSTEQVGRLYQTSIINEATFRDLQQQLLWEEEAVNYLLALYTRPVPPEIPEPVPPPEIIPTIPIPPELVEEPPIPMRELTPAIVGRLYQDTAIRLLEGVRRLRLVPYHDRDIILFLSLYCPDPLLIETARLYKDETITLEQATRRLLELGYLEEEIALVLTYM